MRQLIFWAFSGLLPSSCILCGTPAPQPVLCPGCAGDLPPLPPHCCPQCGQPTARGERCGHCLSTPPHFDGTRALYSYDFPLDRLIHGLKYGHQLAIAAWCGEGLATALAGHPIDVIMPMPLHPDRLRQRGFNQAMEIARSAGRILDLPIDNRSLCRSRATAAQADLPLRQREHNVRGAFECRQDLQGRRILLVDDVMTTGATMDECARILKIHGAGSVTAAVVARALRH